MFGLKKTRWFCILLTLLALRLTIGWHFYTEGVSKLRSGGFSAEPFLRSAKGPLAVVFQGCIGDEDGRARLGLVQTRTPEGELTWQLDPLVTEELWKGYVYRTAVQLGFGDPRLISELADRCRRLRAQIDQAAQRNVSPGEVAALRKELKSASDSLELVRNQKEAALAVAQKYGDEYRAFLEDNEPEILAYFGTADRADGFDRDGRRKNEVVLGVSSLRSQAGQIDVDRTRDARNWLADVDGMWDGVEADVNALAIPEQGQSFVKLVRPHRSVWSPLPWIDRIIPWFDTIVGGLLLVGLLTPLASLAGAGFLLSIIAAQPPWIPGSAPTISQTIEMVGLLVVFACGAGRIAGLDGLWFDSMARWRAAREHVR